MQVLYAPGKRLAFRLRWYLILFLILLPALWLAGRYGLELIRVEAPALVRLPSMEVRAMQPGQVKSIPVQAAITSMSARRWWSSTTPSGACA